MDSEKQKSSIYQKRHYEDVASIINAVISEAKDAYFSGVITAKFIKLFAEDNERFSKQKFYDACTKGIHEKEK